MIRVAMVGAGGMARSYRKIFASFPSVKWALAVDLDPEVLSVCKAEGAERVSSNFADALGPDVDLVNISTPNHLHEEQAVAALKAGKHVLLEKPMTNNLPAADRLVAAARQARGVFGMFMSERSQPIVWEIKRLVASGALGQIQSVRARDAHRGGLGTKKETWRGDREKTGGGAFVQLAVHSMNQIQWWLDSRISEVCAFSDNQYCPNVGGDDVTAAAVKFANGTYGVFDSGWASACYMREIYGTKGYLQYHRGVEVYLELDAPYEGEIIKYTTPRKRATIPVTERWNNDLTNPYNQHRMFIEHLLAGKPPPISVDEGRQDVAVVTAVYESAETGRRVKVT